VLRTRIITAVALLLIVLGMVFLASKPVWALFVLVVALLACWEWSRMCGLAPAGQALYLAASGAVGACLWLMYLHVLPGDFAAMALTGFIIAAAFWVLVVPWWLARKLRPSPSVCAAAGWIVAWPTWLAFVVLRDLGPWVLLALAALVWVADIAAYFAGKRFGKHKLAPAVSPGKTWEGVAGGMVGVFVYALVLCQAAAHGATPLSAPFQPAGGAFAVVAMVLLTAVSILGDLFESWMKRGAGLKDSSQLLPGHGGVLDRIDALTSTLPVAALVLFLAQR
jgi:phosphatidate cytidylyltransferase